MCISAADGLLDWENSTSVADGHTGNDSLLVRSWTSKGTQTTAPPPCLACPEPWTNHPGPRPDQLVLQVGSPLQASHGWSGEGLVQPPVRVYHHIPFLVQDSWEVKEFRIIGDGISDPISVLVVLPYHLLYGLLSVHLHTKLDGLPDVPSLVPSPKEHLAQLLQREDKGICL